MPQITLTRADAQRLVDFCAENKSDKFFVAKDTGAYLGYSKGSKPEQQCLFYFKGCNPATDPNYWDNGQAMFGGDDFGEHYLVQGIVNMLAHAEVKKIKFSVTTRTFKIEGLTK